MQSGKKTLGVAALLACLLNTQATRATDFPGLDREVPGFNNLPFPIPNGDAHICYRILDHLKPYQGDVSAIEDFLRLSNIKPKRGGQGYYFNVPLTDIYFYSRSACNKSCRANLIVKTTYNIDDFEISIRENSYIEMYTSNDDWHTKFGFQVSTHDTNINKRKKEFIYNISRPKSDREASIEIRYGIKDEEINYCLGQ